MSSFVFKIVNIRDLEALSLERYVECPKFVTIVRHVDHTDDSEFHCVPSTLLPLADGTKAPVRNFIVPYQDIIMVQDINFGRFCIVKVLDTDDGPQYWLISSVNSRTGFIILHDSLPENLLEAEKERI